MLCLVKRSYVILYSVTVYHKSLILNIYFTCSIYGNVKSIIIQNDWFLDNYPNDAFETK